MLYKWIVQTNHGGSILGGISGVHAMTDVTGFGLAGHLLELCKSSGLGSVVESNKLPRIAEAETFASQFILPDNAMRNWNAYEGEIDMRDAGTFGGRAPRGPMFPSNHRRDGRSHFTSRREIVVCNLSGLVVE
jgi:hypothetical protein